MPGSVDRPISAPAVLGAAFSGPAAPMDAGALVDYYCGTAHENCRLTQKPAGAVFTRDQHPLNYVETAKALLMQLPDRPRREAPKTPKFIMEPCAEDADESAADPAAIASLNTAERQREDRRRWVREEGGGDDDTAKAPFSSSAANAFGDSARAANGKRSDTARALDFAVPPAVAAGPIFSSIAGRKTRDGAALLDSLASAVRRSAPSNITSTSSARHTYATILQREFRRHRAAGQALRLLAVLHLIRAECAAPRCPMLLSKGLTTPGGYLAECVLEYEYTLEVENLSRRLVSSSRQKGGNARVVRKCVLTPEELSALHEVAQDHINTGEPLLALDQDLQREASAVGAACLPSGLLTAASARYLDRFLQESKWTTGEHSRQQLANSFASFLLEQRKENSVPCNVNEPTADVPPPPSVKDKQAMVMEVLRRGAAAVASDGGSLRRLAAAVPKDWFAGHSYPSGDDAKGSEQTTGQELAEVPYNQLVANHAAQSLVAPPEPVWTAENDPELEHTRRIASRRALRRTMGAEYSSDSDAEEEAVRRIGEALSIALDDEDLPSTAELMKRRKAHEEALKQRITQGGDSLPPPSAGGFDPLLWGLVGTSQESSRRAAAIILGKDETAGEVRRMILRNTSKKGEKQSPSRAHSESGPSSPTVSASGPCVVCELNAVGTRRCICGNWLHPECSMDPNSIAIRCSSYCS
jgi:hypothetical protein